MMSKKCSCGRDLGLDGHCWYCIDSQEFKLRGRKQYQGFFLELWQIEEDGTFFCQIYDEDGYSVDAAEAQDTIGDALKAGKLFVDELI